MSDRERSSSKNDLRVAREPKMQRGRSRSRSISPHKPRKYSGATPSPERGGKGAYRGGGAGGGRGGGRYRSRSRSAGSGSRRRRYSRSHSRSYSHSPMSSRRRHQGDRENPTQSRCLGVFGLSIYTTETQINHIFSKYGPVERVQVVIDAKTGRSRGFCFVYFEATEDAKAAKEQCSGMEIDGRRIRVDFSITQRAHTPTPGIYMGKPTFYGRDNGYERAGRDRGDDHYGGRSSGGGYRERRGGGGEYRYRRSPSPYRRAPRRYDRERSYSPRRY